MGDFSFVDIYASKGIEYLIVIGFFLAIAVFYRTFTVWGVPAKIRQAVNDMVEWFRVPEGLRFHPGHSWLKPGADGTARAGVDDFAQKLVGKVSGVELPPVGTKLVQGEEGWRLQVDDRSIPMLSPVGGEVVAVNLEALRQPALINDDPFGAGWLVEVRSARPAAESRNLLSGKLARRWTEEAIARLRAQSGGELGPIYEDGGVPVAGLARALAGEKWAEVVGEHFLTAEPAEPPGDQASRAIS